MKRERIEEAVIFALIVLAPFGLALQIAVQAQFVPDWILIVWTALLGAVLAVKLLRRCRRCEEELFAADHEFSLIGTKEEDTLPAAIQAAIEEAAQIDWRARAVAHAGALKAMLTHEGQRIYAGTFGETWLREAEETIRRDLGTEPFGAGCSALHKDGTLADESDQENPDA